jgi:hypothetical protein
LVPVSARAATIIIDGDTIDIVRIRIVQIDTPAESHERFLISIRRRPVVGFLISRLRN